VRKATANDAPWLAESLARAFYEDPVMRWVLPNELRRLRQLDRALDSVFLKRLCFPHDETYTTESIAGGALWLPSGKWQLGCWTTCGWYPTSPRSGVATCPGHFACSAT
jgi:hypothetical protein